MQDFRKLIVWQKAHQFTLDVYKITIDFPKQEVYGLTSQLRRSSISIAANICEGSGKNSDIDFARYLQISLGSASESEYYLILSFDLKYLNKDNFDKLLKDIDEVKRILIVLIKKLRNTSLNLKA